MASERIEAKRAATRSRIVTVALRTFVAKGFEATTNSDIADQLQMTGPSLYYYFPTKDAMLFACMEQVLDQLIEALGKAADVPGSAVDQLAAMVRSQVQVELKQGSAAPLINAHLYGPEHLTALLSEQQREVLRQKQRVLIAMYRDRIGVATEQGLMDPGNPSLATFNVLAIIQYSSVWYRPKRGRKLADVVDAQVQAVLKLLGVNTASPIV